MMFNDYITHDYDTFDHAIGTCKHLSKIFGSNSHNFSITPSSMLHPL